MLGGLARELALTACSGSTVPSWAVVLGINLAGSAVIGLAARCRPRQWLTTGVLGGFTTFSGWVLDVRALWPEQPWLALGLVVVTPVLCGAAALAGTPREER